MKNLLLLICLFLSPTLKAQTITVSEPVSTRDDYYYEIIPDGRGNVLLFRDQSSKIEVLGYDSRMQKKWDKEIELDKKRPEVVKAVPMGGDFCVFYLFKQKAETILKVHRYNPAANLVDSVTVKNLGSKLFSPRFEVEVSEDKKVALLYMVEQQKEITAYSFHMGRMKLLWEKTLVPDDLYFDRDFLQMLLDNDGNMHLVLKKENRKSRQSEHYLEIFDYGESSGNVLRRYTIPMKGHLTYSANFTFDNLNQSLVAGGLFADDNLIRADGYFYLNIPRVSTGEHLLEFHPFEDSFINILMEREKSKNKGVDEVSVQEVVLRRDGGIIFIGEMNKHVQRGVVSGNYSSRSSMRPIVDHYYDDLFLISIHPNGQEHWKTILHKKQYSQDDDAIYSSYFLAKRPTALQVVFNDEIKNENTVSEYVVRSNGDYDRNAVMNTERKELSLRFREAVQISANEFIVPSERRNRLKLVRVSY